MKRSTMNEAVAEAKRFVKLAEALLTIHSENKYDGLNDCPREQGAAKRASMDLTRKLADLRLGR